MPALLALASAATFGVADFLGGLTTRKAHVVAVTLLTNLAGLGTAIVLVAVLGGEWTVATIAWGTAAGLCGLAGLVFLYSGLAVGPIRLVSPLSAVLAAVVPVVAGIGLGDRPDRLAIVGLLITPPAVWFVAGGELRVQSTDRRPLLLAVGAGLGFGFFFTLIANVPDGGGAVPLVVSRLASVTVLLIAALSSRPQYPDRTWSAVALVAGALDMTANGLFLWSTREGDLAIVGALVNLFPATTVLLAVMFLRERLTRPQLGGLALAVCAAALLS